MDIFSGRKQYAGNLDVSLLREKPAGGVATGRHRAPVVAWLYGRVPEKFAPDHGCVSAATGTATRPQRHQIPIMTNPTNIMEAGSGAATDSSRATKPVAKSRYSSQ